MRSILFFDLPTITDSDRKHYRKFVTEIKKLGFYMIQESVYVKMSIDHQTMNSTIQRIKQFSPKRGSIMVLNVTEKQFSQLNIIIGENTTDIIETTERVVIL